MAVHIGIVVEDHFFDFMGRRLVTDVARLTNTALRHRVQGLFIHRMSSSMLLWSVLISEWKFDDTSNRFLSCLRKKINLFSQGRVALHDHETVAAVGPLDMGLVEQSALVRVRDC
jgi:hypothetical protein